MDAEVFQQNLKLVRYLVDSPVKARHWETILCSSGDKVMKTALLTIKTMNNLKVNLMHL